MAESKIEKYKKSVDVTAVTSGFSKSDLLLYRKEVNDNDAPSGKSTRDNFFYVKYEGGSPVPAEMMAIFDAICEADVKLVEVPIYKKIITVSDFPPAPPEVDIVPLNDRENEIKINFFPGTVGRELEPIIIKDSDMSIFGKIRKAQDRALLKSPEELPPEVASNLSNISDNDESFPNSFYAEPKIIFKSDDFVTRYELYRLEVPPMSYRDFENNRIDIIDSTTESSYIDNIEQNKKYYYTFRSIDVHLNISNPSPVYQVEMVENSGVYYPIISVYQFEQEQQNFKSKPLKRFLKISAAPSQQAVDWANGSVEASDLSFVELGKDSLGNNKIFNYLTEEGSELGNKKFKFRLKSRHTGKIIDLNVKFKMRKPQLNETVLSCGDDGYIEKKIS